MNTFKPGYRAGNAWIAYPQINTAARAERVRRWIVNLVFVIYGLLIFEGVLRKWVFPEIHRILFFVRDPFVLLVYWMVLKNRMWPRHSPLLTGGILLGVVCMLPGFLQLTGLTLDPLVFVYGWRNYFLYMPLAFIIGEHFRFEDLNRLIRQTLFIAVPIAVLVFLQFSSPPNAVINESLIEGGLYQPGVFRGIIRTYGTFTSSSGQFLFIGSIIAMVLLSWLLPKNRRPVKAILLLAASGAALTNLGVSGSRAAFVLSAVIFLSAMAAVLFLAQERMKKRAIFITLLLGFAATLIIPTVFPAAFEALVERSAGAYETESEIHAFGVINRAFSDFGKFRTFILDTPLLGYGLGLFGNANSALSFRLLKGVSYPEDDWSRNVVELGPILGLLYICLRIALVAWLTKGAITATRRTNNPLPMLMIGFIGIILLYGQITGQS